MYAAQLLLGGLVLAAPLKVFSDLFLVGSACVEIDQQLVDKCRILRIQPAGLGQHAESIEHDDLKIVLPGDDPLTGELASPAMIEPVPSLEQTEIDALAR